MSKTNLYRIRKGCVEVLFWQSFWSISEECMQRVHLDNQRLWEEYWIQTRRSSPTWGHLCILKVKNWLATQTSWRTTDVERISQRTCIQDLPLHLVLKTPFCPSLYSRTRYHSRTSWPCTDVCSLGFCWLQLRNRTCFSRCVWTWDKASSCTLLVHNWVWNVQGRWQT